MALTHHLGGVDPLPLEVGRHPDVGDDHLGRRLLCPGHQGVVVAGDADHLHVLGGADQGPDALTDDQVVVGQEHGDLAVGHCLAYLTVTGPNWSREAATTDWRDGSFLDPATARLYPRGVAVRQLGGGLAMRIESSVTSLSWIPSEAISGVMRLPFDLGPVHYDDPPPDHIS